MLALLLPLASAQDTTAAGALPAGLNTQLFRPTVDGQRTLWTNDTLLADSGETTGRGLLSYASSPLTYTTDDGEVTELVSDVFQLSLLGAHTRGPVRLGLDLPLYLRAAGALTGGETGLGDVGVSARLTALDRREAPVGAAVAVGALLPTATVEAPLGISGLGWEVEGIVDAEIGGFLLAANVGHRGQPEVALENLDWDDQLYTRVGAGYALTERSGLSADLSTSITYGGLGSGGVPVELLGGGYHRPTDAIVLRGGLGGGLNDAIGSPGLRAVLAVCYEPARKPAPVAVVEAAPEPPPPPQVDDVVEEPSAPPTPAPSRAVLRGERIEIEESVYFETGAAGIMAESHALLSDVVVLLGAHPEITVVRIEGHTDSRGSASTNKALSQQRAEAVRDHLIAAGIAPERLQAVGYGEERPLVSGSGADAMAKNRRVDFIVIERADP